MNGIALRFIGLTCIKIVQQNKRAKFKESMKQLANTAHVKISILNAFQFNNYTCYACRKKYLYVLFVFFL